MKAIKWILIILILLGILAGIYYLLLKPLEKMRGIYMIPDNAAFILAIDEPLKTWDKILSSPFIEELKENKSVVSLSETIATANAQIKKQQKIINILGVNSILMSGHMEQGGLSLLYVFDIPKASNFSSLSKYLEYFLNKKYDITHRTYETHKITELYDLKKRTTTYVAFIKNQMLMSDNHDMIEKAIVQHNKPVIGRDHNFIDISKKIQGKGVMQLYLQYKYLYHLLAAPYNEEQEYLQLLCNSLNYTGLSLDLSDEKNMVFEGYTNMNDSVNPLFEALRENKNAKMSACKIIPQKTTYYISMAFDDFNEFYSNMQDKIKQSDDQQSKDYLAQANELEKQFDIDIHEDFIDMVDDELWMLSLAPPPGLSESSTAFIIKAKNNRTAIKKMDHICNQVKKNTPIKFKEYDYKGYGIKYIAAGWFLKLLFSNALDELDKPYYIVIDEYIIFSDLPYTLKTIIDDYENGKTLFNAAHYTDMKNKTKNKGSLFYYIQPLLMNSTTPYLSNIAQANLQMINKEPLLQTRLLLQPADENLNAYYKQIKTTKATPFTDKKTTASTKEIMPIPKIYIDDLDANSYSEHYETGELKFEVNIKNGKVHGRYKAYYKNGETKIRGRFRDGKKDGTWVYYAEDGGVLKKITFGKGKPILE